MANGVGFPSDVKNQLSENFSSPSSSPTTMSLDSGICTDDSINEFQAKIKQHKFLLFIIERDKEMYRQLRDRLCRIVDRKAKKKTNEQKCNVCCNEVNTNDSENFKACSICQRIICREQKCSEWISKESRWECHLCHTNKDSLAQTTSWVEKQFSFNNQKGTYPMRARSEIYIPLGHPNDSEFQLESISQIGTAASTVNATQKMKIREYVEEIVAKMLGGPLDNVAVTQLSHSQQYLQLFQKYHSELSEHFTMLENCLCALVAKDIPYDSNRSGEFRGLSHIRLRQLIECIVAETLRLPSLSSIGSIDIDPCQNEVTTANGGPINGQYFEPNSYQELLATAVLNKIVDSHAIGRRLSGSTPNLSSGYDRNHNALHKQSTSSDSSSIEPQSESSSTETNNLLKKISGKTQFGSYSNLIADSFDTGRTSMLSDYIASHMVPLPDISGASTTTTEIDPEDIEDKLSQASTTNHEDTWERNWLFKKKQNSGQITSTSSVGMLVPAPKNDIRAQIGDKTADEISDLSEAGSDTEESSSLHFIQNSTTDPLNDRLLNKHLIGGKNTADVLDEIVDRTSLVSSSSLPEYEPIYKETLNKYVKKINSRDFFESKDPKEILKIKTADTDLAKHISRNSDIISDEEPILPPPNVFSDDDGQSIMSNSIIIDTNGKNAVDSNYDESPTSSITGSISENKSKITTKCEGLIKKHQIIEKSTYLNSESCSISKGCMKDNRLVTDLEKCHRQSELIQNYLVFLENIETPSYLSEDLYLNRCSFVNSAWSFTDDTDLIIGTNNKSSNDFLNKILFSDRISSNSNDHQSDDSTPTVIDTLDSSFIDSETDSSDDNHKKQITIDKTTSSSTNTVTNNNYATNQLHINSNNLSSVRQFESACFIPSVLNALNADEKEHVDDSLSRHFVPGSIAEREYQKWYNAVEMPNNPYSAEALKRRLSNSSEKFLDLPNINRSVDENQTELIASIKQSDNEELIQQRDYQRYSRDYYINDAKYSSGMKKRFSDSTATSPTKEKLFVQNVENEKFNGHKRVPSPVIKDLFPFSEIQSEIYLARPAIVQDRSNVSADETYLEIEAHSKSPSSTNNSSLTQSDDSDTIRIYNLSKQETIIVREKQSNVSFPQSFPTPPMSPTKMSTTSRPIELPIDSSSTPNIGSTTKRTTTQTSYKCLQPKRKLFEPSQVLSFDAETTTVIQTAIEKNAIEEDVIHILPSVKALAQTFLTTYNKSKNNETRWNRPTEKRIKASNPVKNKGKTAKSSKQAQPQGTTETTSHGSADDPTIASDLSSLETDPPSTKGQKNAPPNERPMSPILIPTGYLRNNIAFFENLKNK